MNNNVVRDPDQWWKGANIYQIYPRSFCDSTNDGTGDLNGITSKLAYIAELGVEAIWISPFFESPMADFGYDISNYREVDPSFGSLNDFKGVLKEAHRLGLKVIIDQVLSHTSDQHPWFKESRASKKNDRSDWYVWADPKPDGCAPNNWLSLFGGQAWTWDSRRQQYYLHNFLSSQPDLNFHNPEVRKAQLENAKFWLELGVDGFRFDVVNFYYHDRLLTDNPAREHSDRETYAVSGDNPYSRQRHEYDITQVENLTFLCDIRSLLESYENITSIGEISDDSSLNTMASYTSGGNKLHMAYTFDLLHTQFSADYIRDVIRSTEAVIGDGWPCWAASNHDVVRHNSRWGQEHNRDFAKMTLALLMSLRGSVCLYQGDELGLPQAEVPYESLKDPYGLPFWPEYKGRDGCRTPMPWSESDGAGFSNGVPWLPISDEHRNLSVESQLKDHESVLRFSRRLTAWRKSQAALIYGDIELIEGSGDIVSWVRSSTEQSILVVINTGATLQRYDAGKHGELVGTHLGFTAQLEEKLITLPAFQVAYLELQ